jgi:hypothetical protein
MLIGRITQKRKRIKGEKMSEENKARIGRSQQFMANATVNVVFVYGNSIQVET